VLEAWGSFTGAFVGEIQFDWHPEPAIIATSLRRAAGELEDMSAPLAASRQLAQANIQAHFDTKSGPDGAWAPWSPNYADEAAAANVGGLGERTGATRAAATSASAFDVTAHEVFYNTSNIPEQGQIFHHGASRSGGLSEEDIAFIQRAQSLGMTVKEDFIGTGGNVQPPRPFMGIDEETQLKIVDVFDQWFAAIVAFAVNPSTGVVQVRGAGGRFGGRVQ
jgi:hypothetical protein